MSQLAERLNLARFDDHQDVLPRLWTYVVDYDLGFAPNPFGTYCTLATCKPGIRKFAVRGDWVMGTAGKNCNVPWKRLVYAMRVAEKLTFADYDRATRFADKKPLLHDPVRRCGDNLYYEHSGVLHCRPNPHHRSGTSWKRDLSGKYVLVSEYFYYFGMNAVTLPKRLEEQLVITFPREKYRHDPDAVRDFLAWLQDNFRPGMHAQPAGFNASVYGNGRGKWHELPMLS